jgi:hypothetical protein
MLDGYSFEPRVHLETSKHMNRSTTRRFGWLVIDEKVPISM